MSETNQAAILVFIFSNAKQPTASTNTTVQVVEINWGCWLVCFSCYRKSEQQSDYIGKFRCTGGSTRGPRLTPSGFRHQMIPFLAIKKKYKKTNCPTGSEGQLQRRYSKNIWEMTSPGSMRACQGFVLCQEQPH